MQCTQNAINVDYMPHIFQFQLWFSSLLIPSSKQNIVFPFSRTFGGIIVNGESTGLPCPHLIMWKIPLNFNAATEESNVRVSSLTADEPSFPHLCTLDLYVVLIAWMMYFCVLRKGLDVIHTFLVCVFNTKQWVSQTVEYFLHFFYPLRASCICELL